MSLLIIFCGVALLFLVHFSESSSDGLTQVGSYRGNRNDGNSQKVTDIVVHGIILWASMGFLMPLGILTMRMSSCTKECQWASKHKILFYVHVVLQVLSLLLVTVGAVLSIRKFENLFNNTHQRIGLALYGAIYVQVLIGCKRPQRGTRNRGTWYFLHWILGTTISLVAILNVYTGLSAYHKRTSRNTSLWTIIFTAQISFMTIFYLFQDKWDYIQKQRLMISVNDLDNSTDELDNPKDVLNEPCRKSNALGAYFSRTNELNKLFQLT